MLKGKKVVLGVSGGIAAYKACALTSKLVQAGADVTVIMTSSATEFVTPLTFQALSRNPVYTDTFDEKIPEQISHIDVADWADLIILAPATANLIGKVANGIADDMLTTTLLASEAPVYVAPAMNVHMYAHPAVQNNLKKLETYGYRFIEPGEGYLACGYVGKGRLEEPETIVSVLEQQESLSLPLKGKKVLVTAGPTRERVDPVRFFTNFSTGKMGYAFAQKARELGANVILVSGPVTIDPPSGIKVIQTESAQEMYEAVMKELDNVDVVIKTAAVADYRPAVFHDQKMKKKEGPLSIEMERTKDILGEIGKVKTDQFVVGFAAETNEPIHYGKQKLAKKNADAIVVNNVAEAGAGFGADTNVVTYLNKHGLEWSLPLQSKEDVAHKILIQVSDELKDGQK
ncbi:MULTISPECIES: bifunctional phosphopantothenoylcysteine decarboxylase/phosphopantothenate--cysteine ligase CoaBC [Pontibacillus]|uniref:Coenzyme A biosynthesis bifunctional protein CoaBC n=1 Tax=Pontibacillus chungwhensis TaxID=265426 RepID=A0ABY8V3T7_9BACI|nr:MULTISPECIES: bifunctional phosphopantothenoylcysteine decarboxylase/phosphopantothenate--cysteine ligase CoaBC [Pontibacillus]MCD5322630.1 bifunctional phosphopantothenoylcysteine decarboxylase/phosphopantothenate--cysteine ligase CoaBC [Pontibacillus sp. HN14]WIF99912.1 bifunctional phosphopantothenoylcysteine decarboxylase/phosphopantothenate--cysteine ligase CoaBC [Pontibacillus chungwhensis]